MSQARRALDTPVNDTLEVAAPKRGLPASGGRAFRRPRVIAGGIAGIAALALGIGFAVAAPTGQSVEAIPAADTSVSSVRGTDEPLDRSTVDRRPVETEETPLAPEPLASTTPEPAPVAEAPAAPVEARSTVYSTGNLNFRTAPDPGSTLITVLSAGSTLTALGSPAGGWQKVIAGETTGYVNSDYLSATPPTPVAAKSASASPSASASGKTSSSATATSTANAPSGSYGPCGTNIDGGISARAANAKRAICTTFPDVTSFGGWRADGEHSSGRAFDAMVSGARGREIASWLRANAGSLGIIEVIYEQKIWTTQRSSEGWRSMTDRGSTTANHYDHIHVLVA